MVNIRPVIARALCMLSVCGVITTNATINFSSVAQAEDVPRTKPGEKTVYMVLLPNTDMAQATEMPSMQRCLDATQYLTRAQCIEVIKPLSGDWPEEILQLIPPPDDEPY